MELLAWQRLGWLRGVSAHGARLVSLMPGTVGGAPAHVAPTALAFRTAASALCPIRGQVGGRLQIRLPDWGEVEFEAGQHGITGKPVGIVQTLGTRGDVVTLVTQRTAPTLE